ncbi:hypothetical protein [Chondromyces apiculatus]|uniref:Uncharacterized protein n=1 Tax=Chondromyces apiculatus DSM 436 TaxID=1192034 RepID=A0A017TAH1_9BACT|nr:hypothetical protein [Chondromyces apiculatus]EYF05586.1 Hypothetical protein CAP_3134 [Chondromyces apiculatus DSM 436]
MDAKAAQLDQEVARAVARWRDTVRALRRGGPAALAELLGVEPDADTSLAEIGNPLTPFRRVSSRATFLTLARRDEGIGAAFGLPGSAAVPILGADGATPISLADAMLAPDPLSQALAGWVQHLTLERVLFDDRLRLAEAWHAPVASIDAGAVRSAGSQGGPARGKATAMVSAREALLGLLGATRADARRSWADALVEAALSIAEAARVEAERRDEAARVLGVDPAAAPLDLPCDPPEAALHIAASLLERSAALVEPARSWEVALDRAVARDAADGWPARLTRRWVEDLFRPGGVAEGLTLDLGPLPRAWGASSFARALGRFGAALAEASAPRSAPFALVRVPFDLRRARRAALFAGLPADPVFYARVLGLGGGRARDQARIVARAQLLTLRLDAARMRLLHGRRVGLPGHPLLLPRREATGHFEEETRQAIGAPIPGVLAGIVPDLSPGASLPLLGALLAVRDRRQLIDRFDDDWFRNPRAAEAIRDEDSVFPSAPGLLAPAAPRLAPSAADLEEGLSLLLAHLSELG